MGNVFSESSIDYESFLLGLSSAALSYLGIDAPEHEKSSKINLELAKQNIDIIALLKEKTKGNLNENEQRLNDQILYDLRLKFSESVKIKFAHRS